MGFIQTTKNLASQILKYAPHTDLWLGTNPKSSQRTVPLKKNIASCIIAVTAMMKHQGFFLNSFFYPTTSLVDEPGAAAEQIDCSDLIHSHHGLRSPPLKPAWSTACAAAALHVNTTAAARKLLAVFSLILLLISGEPRCWWHQKFHIISDLSEIMLTYSRSPNGNILH